MMELRQMLGNLTTALATMSSTMDQFQASSVDITSAQPTVAVLTAQPGTRAGGTTTASASTDLDMEQNIRNTVEHRVSIAHHPALATSYEFINVR